MTQLDRLKSAIEFFDSNKNQSQKKENEQLWIQGKQNVEREFEQLLNKFSEATLTFIEKDTDNEKYLTIDNVNNLNFKENDLLQIKSIIDWFKKVEPPYLDKLYDKLMKTRNQLILDRLKKIKENRNIFNNKNMPSTPLQQQQQLQNNANNRRISTLHSSNSNASLLNLGSENEKSKTIRSRLTENILSSASDLKRKKSTIPTAIETNAQINEQDFETSDCFKFISCMNESLKMFSIENIFIQKIIDSKEKVVLCKILERIFDPVLNFLKLEAEKLSNQMKQITFKLTSKYVISMFNILNELVKTKQDFLNVFEQSILITKTSKQISNSIQQYLEIFIIIERACVSTLNDISEEIKNDPKNVPSNGNIHSVIQFILTYIYSNYFNFSAL
jgi:hypothetical protein